MTAKICLLCVFKAWARLRCTFFIFDRYMVSLHNFCFDIHKCVFVLARECGTGTRQHRRRHRQPTLSMVCVFQVRKINKTPIWAMWKYLCVIKPVCGRSLNLSSSTWQTNVKIARTTETRLERFLFRKEMHGMRTIT